MSLPKRSRIVQSEKFAEKRRKKLIGVIVIFSLLIIAVVVAVVLFFRLSFFQISSIEVVNSTTVPVQKIENIVMATLSGSYFKIIPKANTLFFPKDIMEKAVTDTFKNIQSISISRRGFSGLVLAVTERTPSALACEGFKDDSPEDQNCFYIDTNGYIFEKVPPQASSTDLSSTDPSLTNSIPSLTKYYITTDKGDDIIGTNIMDSQKFQGLEKFVKGVDDANLSPTGVLVADSGQYEMYIKGDTTIYFDDKTPFESSLTNLLAFWNNAMITARSKATTTPEFDYINLRYGNNIFFSKK